MKIINSTTVCVTSASTTSVVQDNVGEDCQNVVCFLHDLYKIEENTRKMYKKNKYFSSTTYLSQQLVTHEEIRTTINYIHGHHLNLVDQNDFLHFNGSIQPITVV